MEEDSEQANTPSASKAGSCLPIRRLGFCGVDDSVSVEDVLRLSRTADYVFVEWGVLFRPEKEGQPRFASKAWVTSLCSKAKEEQVPLNLAAHLCGARVNEVLDGKTTFVKELLGLGFDRVQVNATKVNGVERTDLASCAENLHTCMKATPELEWIIQKNNETAPLWERLTCDTSNPCENMSILFDDSAGTGRGLKRFQAQSTVCLAGMPEGSVQATSTPSSPVLATRKVLMLLVNHHG